MGRAHHAHLQRRHHRERRDAPHQQRERGADVRAGEQREGGHRRDQQHQEADQRAVERAVGEPAADAANPPADKATLHVARPSQNELTLTVNGQSITLHPEQVGQLIEELAHARASMQPEPPAGIPAGWRFVTTKNPMMVVQKQSNGDRLLVTRHTGYGWVPFTFSPDVVIQMYMLLTQR
ncbi:hypothetical protein BVI434_2710026 [Burkholderia vietnamiensis]|nr:hypothetical protein BVI434_2710026 [Burkholderia vietnamiensis]